MAMDKTLCGNDTKEACKGSGGVKNETLIHQWWEDDYNGFRTWHIMFLVMAGVMSFIILLCCCVKFRIPRTKQEIEADYVRRKILRKFRQRLKAIQNQELDEMDLKRALDKIRAEFKSDTESLAQSEAGFSVATISSAGLQGGGHHGQSSTYRRASQIQIDISDISLENLTMGFGARMALAFSRFFGRSKVSQSEVPIGENGTLAAGNGNKAVGQKEENAKPTTIVSTTKTQPSKAGSVAVMIPEGAVASASQEKSAKKNKGKSKDTKGKDDQSIPPAESVDVAKVDAEKNSKRSGKKKDDAETGKSEKPEKDNKKDKEKHDKAEKEKPKVDKEKEKKDKLEKEREKKEKLEKEKKEKKEKAENEKKEKAEREKKEKAAKAKEKEQKEKPGAAVKENNIKEKK